MKNRVLKLLIRVSEVYEVDLDITVHKNTIQYTTLNDKRIIIEIEGDMINYDHELISFGQFAFYLTNNNMEDLL